MIVERQIPKFGSANYINVLPCQNYPDVLSDLTLVEKAFIARAHSVMSVIKLRCSGTGSTASYHQIRGHMVMLSQNPGPLLTILPSSNLAPHDVICIAQASKRYHTTSDIRLFGSVQRTRVLEALRWLKANNPLYKDIVINLDLLYTWKNEFVPIDIASNILQYKPDLSKQKGYAVNFQSDNFKNKLYQLVNVAGLEYLGYLSGCLYTNTDNAQEHPTTKLVSALVNHKNSGTLIDLMSKALVLSYQTKGYIIPLNNGENPDYFTVAFATLFLFGVGSHLTQKDGLRRV